MKISLSDYRRIVAKSGPSVDWVSDYVLWRPYSSYFSWLFAVLGVRSFMVSGTNVILGATIGFLLLSNSTTLLIVAAVLVQIFHLLDHVDGELARFEMRYCKMKISQIGNYFDGLGHKFYLFWFFSLGWAVAQQTNCDWYTILGFMCGFFVTANIPSDPSVRITGSLLLENVSESDRATIGPLFEFDGGGASKRSTLYTLFMYLKTGLAFSGWHILIGMVCVLDVLLEPLHITDHAIPWRGAFLLFVAPFYGLNFLFAIVKNARIMYRLIHP